MQIKLQQLAPTFIEEEKITGSEIWKSDLAFMQGEKIQVIAPSGKGKTSFIHFLYGMRNDYSGAVRYDDKPVSSIDAEEFSTYRKKNISIVFQDLRLFTEQTVLQNLEIKRQLYPYHSESKILQMATILGVASKLNKLCKTCSYGEQQRIAIIRALQQPFDFLLLDEPFSHLDDANRKLAMDLMEEEVEQRKAGIILADLKKTEYFNSTRSFRL